MGRLQTLVNIIEKDTELTIDYKSDALLNLQLPKERQTVLAAWGFTCACPYCDPNKDNKDGSVDARKERLRGNATKLKCHDKHAELSLEDAEELMMIYIHDLEAENRITDMIDAHGKAKQVYRTAYEAQINDKEKKDHYLSLWQHHAGEYLRVMKIWHGATIKETIPASKAFTETLEKGNPKGWKTDIVESPDSPNTLRRKRKSRRSGDDFGENHGETSAKKGTNQQSEVSKVSKPAEVTNAMVTTNNEKPKKRGRGRPKKIVAAAEESKTLTGAAKVAGATAPNNSDIENQEPEGSKVSNENDGAKVDGAAKGSSPKRSRIDLEDEDELAAQSCRYGSRVSLRPRQRRRTGC
ncbi:hypothetical protein EJ08DRAFT_699384 [Tothia fuscella]|uniref:Uncharacterized protein n=1 Tax=Tothia fuscella TaxID=1048955 RepID=A0A9P4NMA0_9PEZI|nr:hypothetical protein EJ08DRAFT_699384 [Tothia fuscella]